MFNNEKQLVQILTYTSELDEYGQERQGTPTSRNVEMYVKQYYQTEVNNPNYNDIELIGLTEDKTITDANQVVIGAKTYNIKYVIPSNRLNRIMMVKA